MSFVLTIDWKFVVALGGTSIGVILATKMDSAAAEQVMTQAVQACKELAVAVCCD